MDVPETLFPELFPVSQPRMSSTSFLTPGRLPNGAVYSAVAIATKLPPLGLAEVGHWPSSGRTSISALPTALLLKYRSAEWASNPCIPINCPTYVSSCQVTCCAARPSVGRFSPDSG